MLEKLLQNTDKNLFSCCIVVNEMKMLDPTQTWFFKAKLYPNPNLSASLSLIKPEIKNTTLNFKENLYFKRIYDWQDTVRS